jgi:type I restriction enzyme M protein
MREVLERFDFDNTISRLDEAGMLFRVLDRFKNVELHPDKIDNPTMGTIFEELIRKFNEALNENPGEHFTPRDVVHLMVDLMLAGDEDRIRRTPPRPLEKIEADIRAIEGDIVRMLAEVTGSAG